MVVITSGRGSGQWPRAPVTSMSADPLITADSVPDAPKLVPRATLICRPNSHPFQERHLQLDKPEKIGRSVARVRATPNNAIFDCKVLSRNHALLWFENGKFFLQDTKSSNGTFVNSQRLGKGSEESPPRELCSGDIVQFGVDVMENSKKVTHGCIVATLKLYLPDGREAKTSTANINSSPTCPIQSPELYQLQQFVQEAVNREQSVESKLTQLARLMDGVRAATDSSWRALIDEDRLLTRLEMLEGQHALYSKGFGEDKLREELVRLKEDKTVYQSVAKESLKKVLQEKLEAVRKLQDSERCLTSAEEESRRQTDLRESAVEQLAELAVKHEAKLAEVAALETKIAELESCLKEREEETAAAERQWQEEREQHAARTIQQRADDAQQRARQEALQAEADFTRQQVAALRQKLNNKLAEPVAGGSGGDAGMRQTEQQLEAVRAQLKTTEDQLAESNTSVVQLKEDISRSTSEALGFRDKVSALESDLSEARTAAAQARDRVHSVETQLKQRQQELEALQSGGDVGNSTESKEEMTEAEVLSVKVETLSELLAEERRDRETADARLERAETELLVTRNNAQEATLRGDHLCSQLRDAECSLAVRAERQEQLQQQLLQLAASVTEAVEQLQRAQQRHDTAEQLATERQSKAERLQESLTSTESRLSESTQQTETLRKELSSVRTSSQATEQRAAKLQQDVELAQTKLEQLELRLKTCTEERDAAVASAAAASSPVPLSPCVAAPLGQAAAARAPAEDEEKRQLRRQLQTMDQRLRELSMQSRAADSANVMAVAALVVALFIALLYHYS